MLGVSSEDLAQALTNKTSYVRKELYTIILNPEQSAAQRDYLVRDLYAILFAFVVETANHKLAPSSNDPPPPTQIVLLDQPGFQSRTPSGTNSIALSGNSPLIAAYGQNGFEEFCINFADELLQSYIVRNTFEDSVGYNASVVSDGVELPPIATMDNSACVELLRGVGLSERAHRKPGGMLGVMNKACSSFRQGKGSDRRDEEMLQDFMTKFGVHASYVASPGVGGVADKNLFGINHYAGPCSYDVTGFVEKDTDLLDSSFVSLLRNSSDTFVSKLVSGPSLATETHHQDSSIIVQAQVSSRPLRQPTTVVTQTRASTDEPNQLDPSKIYPLTTQLNHNLSELFSSLDKCHLWTVSCIRPNDSGLPNSFDKRRVKAQIRSLLLPDIISRRKTEFVVDFDVEEFCERYVPTIRGEIPLRIRQCAQKNGIHEGVDYVLGHRSIWLTYTAWKLVEDVLRDMENERNGNEEVPPEEDPFNPDDAATEHTHEQSIAGQGGFYESQDNLLLARTGTQGTNYFDANNLAYGQGGLRTPGHDVPAYTEQDDGSAWGSEWDKKAPLDRPPEQEKMAQGDGGMVVNNAPNAVEEVPTSRTRRIWLIVVRLMTFYIPDFMLTYIGRMKRPDIRLAWREKLTICLLIFLCCCLILFYIIFFGLLLCPDLNKAWNTKEVGEHTGTNDFFVSIQGRVYDVSNFVHGQHSDIPGTASNAEDFLDAVAGTDMTGYFPPPLFLACSGLVSDQTIELQNSNFTPVTSSAVHTSGVLQSAQSTKLDNSNWYTDLFLPKINQFHKGPLVFTPGEVKSQAEDPNTNRYSHFDRLSLDFAHLCFSSIWGIYQNDVFDLTPYVNTQTTFQNSDPRYEFLDSDIVDVFQQQAGQDITKTLNSVLATKNDTTQAANMACLKNMFFVGNTDFRKTPRCQVQNGLLLAFSVIIMTTIGAKCELPYILL